MSDPRLRRMGRVLDVRARAVDEAERLLAEAARATIAAREAAAQAERAWEAQALKREVVTVDDLATASAFSVTLRKRAEEAHRRVDQCVAEEERRRTGVRAAKTELRKIETWRDGLVAQADAEAARKERIAGDDFAARRARSTQ